MTQLCLQLLLVAVCVVQSGNALVLRCVNSVASICTERFLCCFLLWSAVSLKYHLLLSSPEYYSHLLLGVGRSGS